MPPTARALALLAAATPPERIREQAAAILKQSAYQTTLPGPRTATRLALPMDAIAFLLRALLIAGVVIAVVLAATWVARRLRRGAEDAAIGAPEPADPIARITIGEAQQLAAEGRFGEAIHALLLETLEALSRAARLAPSLTSREIVSRVRMAPGARDALADLVAAVEISYFGSEVPGEADYQACLARFHAFLGTYRSAV